MVTNDSGLGRHASPTRHTGSVHCQPKQGMLTCYPIAGPTLGQQVSQKWMGGRMMLKRVVLAVGAMSIGCVSGAAAQSNRYIEMGLGVNGAPPLVAHGSDNDWSTRPSRRTGRSTTCGRTARSSTCTTISGGQLPCGRLTWESVPAASGPRSITSRSGNATTTRNGSRR